jgi:hypothetical protein
LSPDSRVIVFTIELDYHRGRKHQPIVSLKRAA